MLACPYALQNSGWLGLVFLFCSGLIFCYSAYLLSLCLTSKPGIQTYLQIAELALGPRFRNLVTLIVQLELLAGIVGSTIALSNNLVKVFPDASITYSSWLHIPAHVLLPLVGVIFVLPIIWMPNLSWISYMSLGGIIGQLLVVLAVLWAGTVDGIGFHHQLDTLNLGGLARVSGLYFFAYAGHLVVPRIQSSMREPAKYPLVVVVSFSIATIIYVVVGVAGATMFGDQIQSQVTLNLPEGSLVAEVGVWMVILIPLTKYAIVVNPIAVDVERFVFWILEAPLSRAAKTVLGICVRTLIMVIALALAFSVPSFETTMSLVGSVICSLNCVIFPCLFHLRIFRHTISRKQTILNFGVVAAGVLIAIVGTFAAIDGYIHS